ncbi:MAG: acyl--CoA ligase [Clostridiales bacterium]|nr:acyl--CoA ligase [Clostridiales bacterium]
MEKEMQGKPSQEKLYLKYYPKEALNAVLPKTKIDGYFEEVNGEYPESTGLIFAVTGQKISIRQIQEAYHATAKALTGMGLQRGDNVAVSLFNVPEIVYIVLACSKLGLSINMINPLEKPKEIIERIHSTSAKLLFVQDKIAPLFRKIYKHAGVKRMIVVPITARSKCVGNSTAYRAVISWNAFIEKGRTAPTVPDAPYDEKAALIYTHSSGSTGPGKPIVLGHDTFVQFAHMHNGVGFEISRSDKWLAAFPALFATGASSSVFTPLLLGFQTILEPRYDCKAFSRNLIRYRPKVAIATKHFWKYILDDPRLDGMNMSFLRYAVCGGEKVRRHEIRRFDRFLVAHNNRFGMGNGYGQSELGGSICCSWSVNAQNGGNNTIGIPYTHNEIIIRDLSTGEEADYNQVGAVTAKAATEMIGYHNMPTETADYFRNGVANLGDLGHVNERGEYFIDGRISDFIQIADNIKLRPYEMEDAIEEAIECDPILDDAIKDYCVYGIPKGVYALPVIQICISKKYRKQARAIIEKISGALANRMPPEKQALAYKIRTKGFPSTFAGKIDIAALKRETKGFVKFAVDSSMDGR